MHFSRSRVAVIATAGTAALLSLPVVAAGPGPERWTAWSAGSRDQLPSLPAPRAALPAPALPAAATGARPSRRPRPRPAALGSAQPPRTAARGSQGPDPPPRPGPGRAAPVAPAASACGRSAAVQGRRHRRREELRRRVAGDPSGPAGAATEDQRPAVPRTRRGGTTATGAARRTRTRARGAARG